MVLSRNRKKTHILLMGLCIALIVMQQTIGYITHISPLLSFLSYTCVCCILMLGESIRFNRLFLTYIIYLGLSLLISIPPEVFNSGLRYFSFVIVIMITSPLIQNSLLIQFRRYCLFFIILISIIISIISFIFFYLGINFMQYTADIAFSDKGGLFGGLTNHSITLGILSGISVCSILFLGLTKNWKWYIVLIPCVGSLFVSASRGALAATIFGVVVILMLVLRTKRYNKQILKLLLFAIPSLIYAINHTHLIDGIKDKNENRTSAPLGSRDEKIRYRIEEFESSPIIGIGMSTISIEGGDEIDFRTGRIEPGSSWFSILSMTGIIGLIFFLIIVFRGIRTQLLSPSTSSILLVGLMAFFAISLFSEGYIFAAGSPICFILWLILGNCIE